ncbi:Pyridoxamine 5'-phosphate oxidase family protein ustO [Psilocybe cubensis]|uniref:Pyridoxamine 5'-phosphate oxidase N-terminal domain-containing protein n=2 Tax=Psilocybe cubensis TaxID=181762 RepID=A0A8H8CEM0_PSICU|nr:Pyridoxamine 5'-phosphate oxidase family protein ustO [Psilocybe cubensis]KAH9476200.1 Pyridoxamine 5'-phosphate oxidase family protein ustO [Psilocybe cubensis]
MGKFLQEIPDHLIEWILQQEMFWVATAPLSSDGHVNISPKGIKGTFHVVNSRRVWYEDLSGTGAETVAHIRENGRITILFHAFEGPARIVRLYGKGFFYELGTPEYEALVTSEQRLAGSRAVIGLDITKVGTTCGYAVPYYQFISHRTQLMDWAARKESVDQDDSANVPSGILPPSIYAQGEESTVNPKGMRYWWQQHNLVSLDGLPAFSINFGLGFPFVFSLGRLRASKIAIVGSNPNHSVAASISPATRLAIHGAEASKAPLSVGVDDSRYNTRSFLESFLSFLPFFLTLLIGVIIGRTYDKYAHVLSSTLSVGRF